LQIYLNRLNRRIAKIAKTLQIANCVDELMN